MVLGQKPFTKRNHYNPKLLSRRFTDQNGNLFFFDKRCSERGVRIARPENLFVQGHLYTAIEADGSKNSFLETFFSELENRAKPVIDKIVESARKGCLPGLTDWEKKIWDHFSYYQWKRVPECIESTSNIAAFESSVQQLVTKFEREFRPLTLAERENLSNPRTMERMRQNAIVESLALPSARVLDVLSQKGLAIFITRKPKKSFVLGSRPVLKLTAPGRTDLSHPEVEMWLPIAYDIAVSPMPSPPCEKIIECTEDRHVRHLNEAIFKQSQIIAGRSHALIASLARGHCG